jgi:hypothetical protein
MEDAPAAKRVKAEGGWAAAAEATDNSHAQIKPEPHLSAAGEMLLSKLDPVQRCAAAAANLM